MKTKRVAAAVSDAKPLDTVRERIDRTAYELFNRDGIRAVGVDAIVAHSGVAKKTLYRQYSSKNDLAIAFLRRHDGLWIHEWLKREIEGRASTPNERLLAIFDAFDQWFRKPEFEGCPFLNAMLEQRDRRHPVRKAALRHIKAVRSLVAELAEAAGVREVGAFAWQWQLLMMGAIVAADAGNALAARQAKELGRILLATSGIGTGSQA